jgi:hypothetical protein
MANENPLPRHQDCLHLVAWLKAVANDYRNPGVDTGHGSDYKSAHQDAKQLDHAATLIGFFHEYHCMEDGNG